MVSIELARDILPVFSVARAVGCDGARPRRGLRFLRGGLLPSSLELLFSDFCRDLAAWACWRSPFNAVSSAEGPAAGAAGACSGSGCFEACSSVEGLLAEVSGDGERESGTDGLGALSASSSLEKPSPMIGIIRVFSLVRVRGFSKLLLLDDAVEGLGVSSRAFSICACVFAFAGTLFIFSFALFG